jgi:hypothetical protein
MAKISLVPITTGGKAVAPLSAEQIKELEELWAYMVENPGYHAFWDGDSAEEMLAYKLGANAYLRNRPEGALTLTQIRRQNLPAHQMKFALRPYVKGDN